MLEEFEKRRKVRAITVSTNDGEVNIIIVSVNCRICCWRKWAKSVDRDVER